MLGTPTPEVLVTVSIGLAALALTALARSPAALVSAPRVVLGLLVALDLIAALTVIDVTTGEFRIWLDPSEEPLMVRGDPARAVYDLATQRFGGTIASSW